MEYRKLPHGDEKISVLGLGMGGIQNCSDKEIEQVICKAMEHGINFFDLCGGGKNVYAPFGRAIRTNRKNVYFQIHFGAVYNSKGEYGWSRKFDEIRHTIEWEFKTLGIDYADFGFLHCVDEDEDFEKLCEIGVFDYIKDLKKQGVIRHIGFSSHTPSVANRIIDSDIIDMMMFSINPAYDFERGDAYGNGSVSERFSLFQRCEVQGIGISVMKPFYAGKLLANTTSPFGKAISKYQCLQYALDRPGVLTTVPGVRNIYDLDELLGFADASIEERDYSIVGSFTAKELSGNCVYCNHCQPCPAKIDIGLVNKYYDLARIGDKLAQNHYDKLSVKAEACLSCGHCNSRCPFDVKQQEKMKEIAEYFGSMENDLKKAIRILNEGGYTCVLCKQNRIYTSTKRGVKSLLDWQNSGLDLKEFCAADKVVGKAAAFLYVLLGVRHVYAHVISEAAIDTLTKNDIQIRYDMSVKKIINHSGTGFCPMEEAVWDIDIPEEAKKAIENKLAKMKK